MAALLGVEVPAGAPKPKPLRQQPNRKDTKQGPRKNAKGAGQDRQPKRSPPAQTKGPIGTSTPDAAAAPAETAASETAAAPRAPAPDETPEPEASAEPTESTAHVDV